MESEKNRKPTITRGLLLHLHPPQVPVVALRFSYTFGLGGLALLLLLILVVTGALLMFAYTPSPQSAYQDIVALETEIPFGGLIRSLHHWSGNLLLVVTVLHLLRVFYTAAFQPPRGFNWLLGLVLLGLVVLANFTGYLLPWDQLSYWAVTVAGSIIAHLPLLGGGLRRWLLGGDEVGGATLTNFYALHVVIIPIIFVAVGAFHLWRVRKDRFSLPADAQGSLPANPHLVNRELIFALVAGALLLTWTTWIDAPLQSAANPNTPPNPAKTAWYFLGIQELLLHFHPTVGAVIIPLLALGGLVALPALHRDENGVGVWFRGRGGLAGVFMALGVAITAVLVVADEYWVDFDALFGFLPSSISTGLIPLGLFLLILFALARLLKRLGATHGELYMALFSLLLAAFITLTVIGIALRGENMALELTL